MLYALFAFFAGVFFAADFVVLVFVAAAARRRVDAFFFGALGSVTAAIAAARWVPPHARPALAGSSAPGRHHGGPG